MDRLFSTKGLGPQSLGAACQVGRRGKLQAKWTEHTYQPALQAVDARQRIHCGCLRIGVLILAVLFIMGGLRRDLRLKRNQALRPLSTAKFPPI